MVLEVDSLRSYFEEFENRYDTDKRYMALHNLEMVLKK